VDRVAASTGLCGRGDEPLKPQRGGEQPDVALVVAAPLGELKARGLGWLTMAMLDLNITGMTCGCCSGRVKRALEALPEVQGAHVDHDRGRATVALESDANPRNLIEAVEAVGFGCSP
jgi:copper chaperone CopZ